MENAFRIIGLPDDFTRNITSMSESELAAVGGLLLDVDASPGYPCRATLEDAKTGERVIAISYKHLETDSPYESSGPIFIRENAEPINYAINEIPPILLARPQSLRAYDRRDMMIDADVVEGDQIARRINKFFENSAISYIHIHNAKPGCYNCKAIRA